MSDSGSLYACAIFVVTYGAIASDRVDRTLAALLGGAVVILLGIVNQQRAFGAVDWNVIFLLFGMMVIAGVMRRTGIFGCAPPEAVSQLRTHHGR